MTETQERLLRAAKLLREYAAMSPEDDLTGNGAELKDLAALLERIARAAPVAHLGKQWLSFGPQKAGSTPLFTLDQGDAIVALRAELDELRAKADVVGAAMQQEQPR